MIAACSASAIGRFDRRVKLEGARSILCLPSMHDARQFNQRLHGTPHFSLRHVKRSFEQIDSLEYDRSEISTRTRPPECARSRLDARGEWSGWSASTWRMMTFVSRKRRLWFHSLEITLNGGLQSIVPSAISRNSSSGWGRKFAYLWNIPAVRSAKFQRGGCDRAAIGGNDDPVAFVQPQRSANVGRDSHLPLASQLGVVMAMPPPYKCQSMSTTI